MLEDNYQKQLTFLEDYLKTKGDFIITVQPNKRRAFDGTSLMWYNISHPKIAITYESYFKDTDRLRKPQFLNRFINAVLAKIERFKTCSDYFDATDKYHMQFLDPNTDTLDLVITHLDTNRKYVLTESHEEWHGKRKRLKTSIYRLQRQLTFKPITEDSKWQEDRNPIMTVNLTTFIRKPTPAELEATILNELKHDTQIYFDYN